jgi:excisionase family DNA binding protein
MCNPKYKGSEEPKRGDFMDSNVQTQTAGREPAKLLSAREAAQTLGLSLRNVRGLVKARSVAVVRIGGRLLFDPADLKAFIDSNRIPAVNHN